MSPTPSRLDLATQPLMVIFAMCMLCSCTGDPICLPIANAPQIDWQDIDARVKQVLDVTDLENLSDEQLSVKYTTNKIEAVVRRPTPTANRYLLLVQRAGRQQTIVIPGTDPGSLENVLANFDSSPTLDSELGVEFHRGFHDLADEVRADVEPLLNPNYATHLNGYSLGGAIVAILSLQLHHHGFDVESVVTFGQPKVTLAEGANAFADRPLLRFVAAHDGVPILFGDPPYMHFGDEVILLDGPNIVYLAPGDVNYVLSTDPPPESPNGALDVKDHGTYMTRIASKMGVRVNSVSFCSREQFITAE